MADEPTWDDLFGEPLPPKPTPVPPPAEQQPAQPPQSQQPPVQQPPAQPAPGYPPATSVPQTGYQAPTYPNPGYQAPPQQPTYQPPQQQPGYQAPQQQQYQVPTQPAYSPPAGAPPTRNETRGDSRGPGSRRGGYEPQKPKRRLTWLWILIVLIVLGAGGTGVVYAAFGPQIRHVLGWEPSIDYTGTGDGKTTEITIQPGQFGSDVAASLAKAGVTKTSQAFYDLLLKQKPAPVFEPGTYKLQQQMSAKSALAALSNSANRVVSKVVIPEGFNLTQVEARLSSKTGVKLSDLQAAAANYKQFKLPAGAPSLEGFLFPATYQFSPGTTAVQELQAMVTRMNQALTQHKVPAASELKVLTLASIIQKEAATQPDFYKVSRVFTNRLADHMALQSDATVSYGAHSKSIFTTGAQRADTSNKYNTYAHTGLPPGPIDSPGDAAIKAALHPPHGDWLYFVTVNPKTGETKFTDSESQFEIYQHELDDYLAAHGGG